MICFAMVADDDVLSVRIASARTFSCTRPGTERAARLECEVVSCRARGGSPRTSVAPHIAIIATNDR